MTDKAISPTAATHDRRHVDPRAAAKDWLAAREVDLLPVPYYHVVFRLPAAIADIACQNKAVYDLPFSAFPKVLPKSAPKPRCV